MISSGMLISDRYEIREKIGSGGMAEVYKAIDRRLNRSVAVKILKAEYSNDKSFITRFKNEAQSAAGLSHPNIVSVYDVGDDEGYHYIVMELVEGITLKKFIDKKGKLDVREAVGIGIQIAQGMEAAHDKHIIHRDIKPQNIMISRDGKVKVADFGIAKMVSADTYNLTAVGSVHYLSPEQARGGYSDERSDIYSLGVTLYEMLTGKLPFGGDSDVSVALQHIQNEAKPAREIVPSIPYSLDRVVQKCMQKHPENRYNSAAELILDLKHSITNPNGDFVSFGHSVDVSSGKTKDFTQSEMEELAKKADAPVRNYRSQREEAHPEVKPSSKSNSSKKNKNKNNGYLKEEYEELDTVDSKFEMVAIVIAILVALAVCFFVVNQAIKFFGGAGFGIGGKTTPTPEPTQQVVTTPDPVQQQITSIKMPSCIGYTFQQAVDMMKQLYPNVTVLESVDGAKYSSAPEGQVIEQFPLADSTALSNATVYLTLSAGGKPITVPKTVGYPQNQAEALLTSEGLKVIIKTEVSETFGNGLVTRTEPRNGETIRQGESIIVYISIGSVSWTEVPNIVNKSFEVAKAIVSEAGLVLGEETKEYSETVQYGYIISQSKPAGSDIIAGTALDYTISLGIMPVDPTPTPTLTPTPTSTSSPTPEPGEQKKIYYKTSFDTNTISEEEIIFYLGISEEEFSWLSFTVSQDDSEEALVFLNYELEPEMQGIFVNINSFFNEYSFELYSDYEIYGNLHEGDAKLFLYIDNSLFNSYDVRLEKVEEGIESDDPVESENTVNDESEKNSEADVETVSETYPGTEPETNPDIESETNSIQQENTTEGDN